MTLHLVFRVVVVQLIFFGFFSVRATSSSPSSTPNQAEIKRLEAIDVDPKTRASNLAQLGDIYLFGKGVTKDINKALGYLEEASNQDVNPQAQAQANFVLGTIYSSLKDDVKAREYFEKAAQQDINPQYQAEANVWLGSKYSSGGLKDVIKAREYFEKEARQEIDPRARAEANLWLGISYSSGEQKDVIKAREYLEKAVRQDVNRGAQAEANLFLGTIYLNGGLKDIIKAREYLEKAAKSRYENLGHKPAQTMRSQESILVAVSMWKKMLKKHANIWKRSRNKI